MGSKVVFGNLIVIPIQDSLLYVEPLYIRAENGQLPELQRVIASYSERVVMGETLESTLQALFLEAPAPSAPVLAKTVAPSAVPGAPAGADLQSASQHYNRAMEALKTGNWTAFGAEMQALGQELGQRGAQPHH